MSANVGKFDRLARAILGVVLIALPFVSGFAIFAATWATILSVVMGAVMLATAATRFCLLYRVLGIRTCRI